MAGDTLTTASGILKDVYGKLGDLINKNHPIVKKLQTNTKDWDGETFKTGVITNRNTSARGMSATGQLPVAGNLSTTKTSVSAKVIAGRAQIDVALMNAAKTDRGAFINGTKMVMQGLKESCSYSFHRQLIGRKYAVTGYPSGIVGKVTTGASSATQVFDSNQHFEVGRAYYIGTTTQLANVSGGTSGTVLSISSDGVSVTFTGSITTTTDDYATPYDANGVSYTYEWKGLAHLCNNEDDDYLGVDTGVYTGWAATVRSNSGTNRALTLRLMDETADAIRIQSGEVADVICADDSFWREYVEALRADVRFVPGMMAGGDVTTSYSHGGRKFELVDDYLSTRGKAYYLNTSALELAVRQPWGFMEEDGAILSRVPGYRAYEMTYSCEGDLSTNARNRHGVLADITTTTV